MDLRLDLNETAFQLSRAVLIYTEGGYTNRRTLATVHEIDAGGAGDGRSQIGPGRPVTTGDVKRLSQKLGRKAGAAFLPERVVASTPEVLIWHRRIGREAIFFESKNADLNTLSGTALPHPGLIFRLWRRGRGSGAPRMSVWAKRQRGRPRPNTILYHAPFFNVSSNGSLCHGSMRAPDGFGPPSIDAWERAFFKSAFTHGSGVRFLKGEPGYADTLAALAESSGPFPTERLVRTGSRLRDVIRAA